MHGSLKLSIATDALNISSVWTGLTNPELDPRQVEDGEDGLEDHPSTKLKAAGPDAWSTVRIDGRDWGRVLRVGRLGGRVIACKVLYCSVRTSLISIGFADEHALILYVYLSNYDDGADESVLTVSTLLCIYRNLLMLPLVLHFLVQHMSMSIGVEYWL
jgi:HUS1 checkpoint protein